MWAQHLKIEGSTGAWEIQLPAWADKALVNPRVELSVRAPLSPNYGLSKKGIRSRCLGLVTLRAGVSVLGAFACCAGTVPKAMTLENEKKPYGALMEHSISHGAK